MELKAEEEEKRNRPPPVKKQFSILIADTEYKLRDKDLSCWGVQIPEEDSVSICPERIINVAYEFNTAPESPRMPVKTSVRPVKPSQLSCSKSKTSGSKLKCLS